MNTLREILALIFYATALALLVELFSDGFQWVYIAGACACFWLAYALWPSKKRGQRDDGNWFIDLLEPLIELPVNLLIWCFRLLARLFRGGDNGIDFDL